MIDTFKTYDYATSPYAERWAKIIHSYQRLNKSFDDHRALLSDKEKAKDASRVSAMSEKGFAVMWRSLTQTPKFQQALAAYNEAAATKSNDLVPTQSAINARLRRGGINPEQAKQLSNMVALHDDLKARWKGEFAEGMALSNELTLFKFIDLLHDYDIKLLDNVVCHVWSGRKTGQLSAIEAAAKHNDHATMADDEVLLCIARFYDSEELVIDEDKWEYDYDPRVFGPPSSIFATATKKGSSPTFHAGITDNGKGVLEHGSFTDTAELSLFSAMGTPVEMPELYKIGRANSMRGLQTPATGEEVLIKTLHAQHVLHKMVEKREKYGISLKDQRKAWYDANPDFVERVRAKKRAAGLDTVAEKTVYVPSWVTKKLHPRIDSLASTAKPGALEPHSPKGPPPSHDFSVAMSISGDTPKTTTSSISPMSTSSSSPAATSVVPFGRRSGLIRRTPTGPSLFNPSPLARRPSRRQMADRTRSHDQQQPTIASPAFA
ncbi:MAG: hypothetical protein P1U63_08415 [Coxiellaceae bacterium]|nr:hypothetical protein [Coxiellaceae bacterium]